MKKRFTRILAALALLVGLTIPIGMWGQTDGDFEFNLNQLYQNGTLVTAKTVIESSGGTLTFTDQDENFTILITRNSGNQPGFYTSSGYIRFYSSDTFKLSSAEGITMTKVVVTPNGSNFSVSAMTGLNTNTRTWTGSASEITFTGSGTNKWDKLTITYTTGSSSTTPTTVTIDATGITNTDVYEGTEAGSLVAIVKDNNNNIISGATVSWESSNEGVATINADGEVTLVAAGTTTITANYDGDEQYSPSFNTYELEVTDSTPFTGGDVTFVAGIDLGTNGESGNPDEMSKNTVTISSTNAAFATAQYRLYKSSVTTISVESGTITSIVFNGQSTSYPVSALSVNGNNGSYTVNNNVGTWTGNSIEVSFTAGDSQVRLSSIVVTVDLNATPDPVITAANVSIEYNITQGGIIYEIENPVDGASLQAVVAAGATISNFQLGTVGDSPITFTCDANNTTSDKTATVTLNYVKNGETLATKDVTVTQLANPNLALTTMDEIYARATEAGSTATDVTITFNNWVVSGSSSKNVFVTDNNGKGFIIFNNDGGLTEIYTAGDILSGTAVPCSLKLYGGSAELINVDADDLTINAGGTVTESNIALADLAGINTGALVHYEGLTCSINNEKYYLSDGTTTLQVYNTLYAFNALEAGHTYNITGVYQQYNNTKEILPRSAADIEEVTITEPNVITAGTLSHVTISGLWDGDTFDDITLGDEVEEGTYVYFSLEVEEGYTLESVSVLNANNEEVTLTEASESWYFTMPNSSVTINATATQGSVPPSLTGTITFGSGEGSTNIDDTSVTGEDSMGNTWTITTVFDGVDPSFTPNSGYAQVGSSKKPASSITFTTTLSEAKTIASFEAKFGGFSGTAGNINLYVGEENVGTGSLNATEDVIVESTETATGTELTVTVTNIAKGVKCYYISYTLEEEVTPTDPTITVTGYGDTDGGYVLIASPTFEYADPVSIGMATGNYDLYYYDAEQDLEWRNYKAQDGGNYNLEPGKGYLYANQETVTITFTGTLNPSFSDVELPYAENDVIKSLYLAGNSSTQAQTFYVNDGNYDHQIFNYLTMNEDGDGFITTQSTSYTAPAMTGFFVQAPGEGMALSTYDINAKANVSLLNINVLRDRGSVIDNAIVSFSNGSMMDKFYLKNNTTRVYIPQGNREMAIANSAAEAEMPVSFKASANGTYTLSVNPENVEMNYLHLIDNLTGMDVDLLQTPSYTFEAKTSDYASRFRLVFKANGTNENNAETFAYFNGTNWTVSNVGDATLQVVDVTGRTVANQMINGNAELNLNQPAGVYVIRLVNGDNVKTQKVVVR